MAKLDELKEKIRGLKAQLSEKADKIGFIKKWREKRAAAAASGPKAADPTSLSVIYRDGSTATRLQVIAFYLFVIVAVVSAGSLAKKLVMKMRTSAEAEKLRNDISHGLAEAARKAAEQAEMVSLGQFTANAYVGPPTETQMMSIDLWVKVSDPGAASQINSRTEVFREKTMDALNELSVGKVNLLQESGKKAARERIRASLNTALKSGKVEDVYIQNMIMQ